MKKFLASMVVDLFIDTLLVMGLIVSLLSMLFSIGFIISLAIEPSIYEGTFLGVFSTSASISIIFAGLVFLSTFFQRKKSDFKRIIFILSAFPFAFYLTTGVYFLINYLTNR